jgi:molybdopterin-guanine dinucleotide biosynthesis protein A
MNNLSKQHIIKSEFNYKEKLILDLFINTSVAIIAGGKSSRFGTNKARANYNDKKLIEIALQLGGSISSEIFIITGNKYNYDDQLVPSISDLIPNCGPIGGIYTALMTSSNSLVCTLPCDMPLLKKEIFNLLYQNRSDEYPVVACSENGLEPLICLWPTNLALEIYSYLKEGKYSLRHLLLDLNAIQINIPMLIKEYDQRIFTNINYKLDLENIVNI